MTFVAYAVSDLMVAKQSATFQSDRTVPVLDNATVEEVTVYSSFTEIPNPPGIQGANFTHMNGSRFLLTWSSLESSGLLLLRIHLSGELIWVRHWLTTATLALALALLICMLFCHTQPSWSIALRTQELVLTKQVVIMWSWCILMFVSTPGGKCNPGQWQWG